MGTSRGKNTPTTTKCKSRKSQLKSLKRLQQNNEVISKFK